MAKNLEKAGFGIGKKTAQLQLINHQKLDYEINKNNSISDFIY